MVDLLERRAFVGRERELARLLVLLGHVQRGEGRTAILAGEAGIGKSRLLSRLDTAVAGTARAETGACLPLGAGALPYAPFVEILRHVVSETPAPTLPALLGPGRAVLTRLLPETANREADLSDVGAGDSTAQSRLFELVLGVFQRLSAAAALVVGIEDIHWADRSTRELLAFLVRALRHDRVLFVLTLRTDDDDVASGTLDFVAELERDEGVERIDIEPFDRAEVAEQVERLLDDRPRTSVIDRLFERSDGNPFFVEELVLAGAIEHADMPAVIRDVVASRLNGLEQRTRDVLRAATVGGREIDEELLGEVLHLDRLSIAAALRDAIAAGILTRDPLDPGGAPAFRHALLREAVERELFPAERAALHHACAEALVRRVADGRLPVTAADLARHWDAAREPARALRPMIEAARGAEAVYAWPEALAQWERARVLFGGVSDGEGTAGMSLPELLGQAADCAVLAGEYATAIALGRAAIAAVDARTDATLAGVLHNRLRWYLWESGDRRGAAEAIEAALRLLPADPPSRARAQALAQHAGVLMFAGRYEESIAEARAAIEIARPLELPGEVALASGVLGWDLAAIGDVDAGLAEFRVGQAIAQAIGSPEGVALAAINLVQLLDRVGRSAEQLETALAGAAEMDRLGLARTYGALLLGYAAKAQLVLGQWDEVDRTTSAALAAGAADRGELWLTINRARLLAGRGGFAEARAQIDRANALERRLPGGEFAAALLLAQAELAVTMRDVEAVHAAGVAAMELARAGAPPDASLAWVAILVVRGEADAAEHTHGGELQGLALAEAAARLEAVDGAIRSLLSERPELGGGARSEAIRMQLSAERARLEGPGRPEVWDAVARAWESLARPYAGAYARFRQAEATLAAHGSRDAAAEVLAGARATAFALGATPLLAQIDGLASAGRLSHGIGHARPGLAPGEDPYGFTAREREVLGLVADGRTNQQIADQLFITRKTASVHVSNLMAKLGAANRGEAAAMAHRLGLVGPGL